MRTSTKAAALAALLIDLGLANPIDTNQFAQRDGGFSVQLVAVPGSVKSGPLAHQRTFIKYGIRIPDQISRAADAAAAAIDAVTGNQQGSVTATPETNGAEYLAPVSVAGTELMLDFDTGSSDLWVYSSLQPSSQSSGHSIYTPDPNARLQGQSWSINYGDKSGAGGQVYSGTVTIGGVTATGQAIEAATSVSAQFVKDKDNDGLVGFAFSSINQVKPTRQKTWFDNVQSQLSQPLFTATLKNKAPGTYDFGYIDTAKYTGALSYANADNGTGFWSVGVSGYAVGTAAKTNSGFSAIVDTGTSLLYLPQSVVGAYYAAVPGSGLNFFQGGYTFPCSSKLPSLSISVGSNTYTIPGTFLNYAPVDSSTCFGGLQASTAFPTSILGDVFLKSVFAVFDARGPKVGLAQQAGVDATPYSPPAPANSGGIGGFFSGLLGALPKFPFFGGR